MTGTETPSDLAKVTERADELRKNVERLVGYACNEDAEVRCRALEALEYSRHPDVVRRVIESTKDDDELVRVTSLEIVGSWGDADPAVIEAALECLCDAIPLVRSYAAGALADMQATVAVTAIEGRLAKAEDDEESAGLLHALTKLGRQEYFIPFLNGLFSDYYRTRCVTANLLKEHVTTQNQAFIRNLLQRALDNDDAVASRSAIQGAIADLSDLSKQPARSGDPRRPGDIL